MAGSDDFDDDHTNSKHTERSRGGYGERRERCVTAAELAHRWGVSLRSVRRLIAEEKIPVIRIRRSVRIHPDVAKLNPHDKI
jgi:excisionase family DNA binding protein